MANKKRHQLRGFDLRKMNGFTQLIGVDEAGRGALAGPVVAAAVLITQDFLLSHWALRNSCRINDSKQLGEQEREELWCEFEKLVFRGMIHVNTGVADVQEIENMNILEATKLAMRRAIEGIYPPEVFEMQREADFFFMGKRSLRQKAGESCRILIDGLPLKKFCYPHEGIVKGDARSLCIAMASIVAKVSRDRLMVGLDRQYPAYGFARNKGYGTEEHREALLRKGRCIQHRDKFLRKLMEQRSDPRQMDFFDSGYSPF